MPGTRVQSLRQGVFRMRPQTPSTCHGGRRQFLEAKNPPHRGSRRQGCSRRGPFSALLAAALATVFAGPSVWAQAPEGKTAEQVYKNIVQLKGTPADQLNAAMQFISA